MVDWLNNNFKTYHLNDADLYYCADFLPPNEANEFFTKLSNSLDWRQDDISMFGRRIAIPRLQAWYGEPEANYRYSGLDLTPTLWTPELQQLRQRLQELCQSPFNAVLANFYRNGQDSVGWHADNEPELGTNPLIASLSLGAERRFSLRHKQKKTEKHDIKLAHGSLLIMAANVQQHWLHALPKQKTIQTPRINLSFRNIIIND